MPKSNYKVRIIKRNNILETVLDVLGSSPDIMEQGKVIELYSKLYKYTQVDQYTKQLHIQNIKNNH